MSLVAIGRHRHQIDKGWMGRLAGVTLLEVVDHDLPVGLEVKVAGYGKAKMTCARHPAQDVFLKSSILLGKRRRISSEIDENHTQHGIESDLLEAKFRLVESIHVFETSRSAQFAVKVIGPGVIVANYGEFELALARQNTVRPQLTDDVESAKFTIVTAHQHNALIGQIDGFVATMLGDLAFGPTKIHDWAKMTFCSSA